mmetsp:Transcript_67780/g.107432  ORF Transcript_67780/g.107432 Transcript_67780/m.107432 type:complete len:278 (-) Transcript_67780:1263-2096(-)
MNADTQAGVSILARLHRCRSKGRLREIGMDLVVRRPQHRPSNTVVCRQATSARHAISDLAVAAMLVGRSSLLLQRLQVMRWELRRQGVKKQTFNARHLDVCRKITSACGVMQQLHWQEVGILAQLSNDLGESFWSWSRNWMTNSQIWVSQKSRTRQLLGARICSSHHPSSLIPNPGALSRRKHQKLLRGRQQRKVAVRERRRLLHLHRLEAKGSARKSLYVLISSHAAWIGRWCRWTRSQALSSRIWVIPVVMISFSFGCSQRESQVGLKSNLSSTL